MMGGMADFSFSPLVSINTASKHIASCGLMYDSFMLVTELPTCNSLGLPHDIKVVAAAFDVKVRRYAIPTLWWRRVRLPRAEEAQLCHFVWRALLLHEVPVQKQMSTCSRQFMVMTLTDTALQRPWPDRGGWAADRDL